MTRGVNNITFVPGSGSHGLSMLQFVIHLGRVAIRVIRQNIAFSLQIEAGIIAALFPNWLNLWAPVFGDLPA